MTSRVKQAIEWLEGPALKHYVDIRHARKTDAEVAVVIAELRRLMLDQWMCRACLTVQPGEDGTNCYFVCESCLGKMKEAIGVNTTCFEAITRGLRVRNGVVTMQTRGTYPEISVPKPKGKPKGKK